MSTKEYYTELGPIRKIAAINNLQRPMYDMSYGNISNIKVFVDGSCIEVTKTATGKTVVVDGVIVLEDACIADASTLILELTTLGYIA